MGALRISALVALVLGVLQLVGAGKVGCVYDETVCSGAESCVDDSLFGVCIVRELADDVEVAEINHRILERLTDDEERSRELRLLLTYLGRSGFSWQSPFTQCVIDAFRVSLITQAETAEYGRCVGVHESADGQLTSSFSLADLERETAVDSGSDSADADTDADDESSEEDVEEAAAKRDEQISIHKYFKKLDSNSGARGSDVERRVDDVLSMSNDELRRRIADLRVQVATALYQDRLNGQSNPDKRAGAAESESEDSDADRELTKAMLGSLVNKMKQRVLQRIDELDARRGQDDSIERFAIAEDGSSSEEQLSPNVAGESAMRASAADIEVDKKSPNAPSELSYVMASPSQQPSQYELDRDIDDRFGIIELSGSVSPLVGAEAVFNEIVEVVKWPGSVCLKFDGVTGKTSNILRFYVPRDRLCQGVRAAQFLDAVWDKRELVKQAIRHDVVVVAVGRDKTRMTNAAQQVNETEPNGELLVTVIVCAVVLCIVLLAVIVFIVCTMVRRRRNRSDFDKSLLLGNDAPETYGELCRQRMTATVNEKLEAIPVPVRSLFGRSKVFTARSSPPASKSSPDRSQLTSTSSASAWVDEPPQTNMDITTGHAILSYMEAFLRNPEKLELEWQGLSEYEADRKATNVGQREENRVKNRYPSLLPYDHNRVVLTNYIGGDYVNASFIADHDPRSPAYVATQCPLQETANDFWHMVWEHGGNIIVNLTSCSTRGSDGNNNAGNDTDYHYWPSEGMETFGSLELHLVSEHLVCEDYVVRNFYLKNAVTNETRTITQFHFVSWTDSSVPSIRSLLEFRRKVIKSHHHGKSKPIVVHCSDGCGRTGTYCLVDLVLNRIAKGTVKEVDVGATIEHLRDQRISMVATKKQFEFALMTIADEVNAVLKALAAQQTKQ